LINGIQYNNKKHDAQHNVIYHNDTNVQRFCGECHAFSAKLTVAMLNVVIPSVVVPSEAQLKV